MYLRTPKRYTEKGRKRNLLNLRWLWLYLLAPFIIIPAVLAWDYRGQLQGIIGDAANRLPDPARLINPPTPTPVPTAISDPLSELDKACKAGKMSRVMTVLAAAGEQSPNETLFFSLAARMQVLRSYGTNKDMLDSALVTAAKAINATPEAADGWIMMAMAIDWSGRPQEALGYILRAKELDENNPMVTTIMAEIYHDLKKYEQATKLVDSAINAARTANPPNRAALTHAYYVKAILLESTGADGKLSLAQYENAWRAATAEPIDCTIMAGYVATAMSVYYRSLGQAKKAVDILVDAIKHDQDDPILPYQLAQVYFNLGDRNKARAYAETCRDLDPKELRCLRLLSTFLFADSNYQQSAEMSQRVIDLGSKDSNDYLVAGLSLSFLNQCSRATSLLQRGAAFVDPEDTKLRTKFADALRACGVTGELPTAEIPTATPTVPSAGKNPTVTPTKKS